MEITDPTGRLEQIGEHLRDDPIYVDRAMGNGDAEAVREALLADVDDLPFPAYVVLVHRLPATIYLIRRLRTLRWNWQH